MKTPLEFSSLRVLVVGDLMLDIYKYGTASRMSPEAPVPVVLVSHEVVSAGGAANVAMNLRGLGCQVELIGYIGADHAGDRLKAELDKSGVLHRHSVESNASTISKTRVISDRQHMIRYDDDSNINTHMHRQVHERSLIHRIVTMSQKKTFDVVVVSDYAKGTITQPIMETIKQSFGCPVVCDIKPANKYMFTNVFCVVPNLTEAIEMATDNDSTLKGVAKAIKYDLGLRSVVITLSQNGLFLLDENDEPHLFEAHVSVDQNDPGGMPDVTGAGDTVLSTFASCIAKGYTTEKSSMLGNLAAGIVVRKKGTAVCSLEELNDAYLRV